MRLLIIGVPKAGKTTTALKVCQGVPIRHVDDLISSHGWSDVSAEVYKWLTQPGDFVIEGCAGVRALRIWLQTHQELPDFEVLWMGTAKIVDTPKQASYGRGCTTVYEECFKEIRKRAGSREAAATIIRNLRHG